jgi:hypothetical protein
MRFAQVGAAMALAIGCCVVSQTALAQATTVPVANQPKHCQDLAKKGFTIKSETISRSGTTTAQTATQPRGGSYAAPRKYGQTGDDKWFIDSFPAKAREGCRICGVFVAIKGNVGGSNDSVGVIGSNSAQPQFAGTPLAANQTHLRLASSAPNTPVGPYSSGFMIEGPAYMTWYLNSLAPTLDVFAQDDTTINQIQVTYFWY